MDCDREVFEIDRGVFRDTEETLGEVGGRLDEGIMEVGRRRYGVREVVLDCVVDDGEVSILCGKIDS
ncbi:hypothetical protein MA16_Dca008862 [Dendrobium catenatum]|uniref:Uncharacterized protein n=1 Tax=Dendrobium catenatum TaxID=906689 RepID=A0A2I0VUJ6_9ASPA|nr:hypothetical protein MA16_Dca008862 [Dendrobium catenatum]